MSLQSWKEAELARRDRDRLGFGSFNREEWIAWRWKKCRAEWIKSELMRRGLTTYDLAAHLGVSNSSIYTVINGDVNRFIEPEIAKAIGVQPQWLFPEHYSADGSVRIARRGAPGRRGPRRSKMQDAIIIDALAGPFGRPMPEVTA